ncbi:hypothetical protein BH10PLA2_BH10PLA2_14070 [soil metagenome]
MQFVEIVRLLSGVVVVGFCMFLLGLAVAIVTAPARAERFLRSFASSAPAHYTEQGLRLLVGASLVNFASSMWYPDLFKVFGWLMVVTTAGLLFIPWQWHNKFATGVMPPVIRHLKLFAIGASAPGVFVLYSVSRAVIS